MDDSDDKITAHSRMFAPAIGIDEDPVTGNGAGPLGAYLIQYGVASETDGCFEYTAVQGEAMGRKGQICVYVDIARGKPKKVCIRGKAIIAFKTEILL